MTDSEQDLVPELFRIGDIYVREAVAEKVLVEVAQPTPKLVRVKTLAAERKAQRLNPMPGVYRDEQVYPMDPAELEC